MIDRIRSRLVFGFALALGLPVAAHARTVELALVQAYAPCTSPNATHPATPGSQACAPPSTASPYRLEKAGKIRLSTLGRKLRIRVDLPRVLEANGVPVAYNVVGAHVGFTAWIDVRVTDDACVGADACTVSDARIRIPVGCLRGRCWSFGDEELDLAIKPRAFEVLRIEVLDDQDQPLAMPGLAF